MVVMEDDLNNLKSKEEKIMKFKKIAALALATTMALGCSLTAFAADTEVTASTGNGTGSEATGAGSTGWYDSNVMKVVVPTLANAFDYKVDPEGAVSQSKNYEGTEVTSVADETGLVFKNKDGDKFKVTNSSDPFVITNKSSIPVEVSVTYKATVANTDPLAIDNFSTTADFSGEGDSAKALYIALLPTNDKAQVFNKETAGQTFTTTLLSGEDGYEVKWNSDKYEYTAISDYDKWPTSSFVATGAINKDLPLTTWYVPKAGETAAKAKNVPSLSVTYKFTAVENALSASTYWLDDQTLYIWKTSAADFVTDGEFTADSLAVAVNGKVIAGAAIDTQYKGHVKLSLEQIATAFGYTWADMTADEKVALKGMVKTVKVTQKAGEGTKIYYGEL